MYLLSHISDILTAVSRINAPIPGMFVRTYFNVFLIVVPNMVMTFYNFDIFYNICFVFDLSSALACRMESNSIKATLGVRAGVFVHCKLCLVPR